jgi:hypothetical protein
MPRPTTAFQRRVLHYMRAIARLTGRWPDYHSVAAEVAAAEQRTK